MSDPGLAAAVPFRFACQRCAHCCTGGSGYVWLADGEVEALSAELGASVESFARRFVRRVVDPRTGEQRLALREDEAAGGRCALLVGANECSVYASRPAHCRAFPYWPSVMEGGAGFEAARATCPGIAVVVPEAASQRAFDALEAFRAAFSSAVPEAGCCLERGVDEELYVSALEADHAVARARDGEPCRLGVARPLACRVAHLPAEEREAAFAALRALERDLCYPRAFGPIRAMMHAREGAS